MHCFEYVVDHEYKMSSAPRSDQPSKQKRMKVGHPCTKKRGTKISNALLPLSLMTCS